MKIFHLSDLHIGLKLYNRDLSEDQEYILNQIADLARIHRPDVVIIAGDIYDRAVPSAESVRMFDRFVMNLRAAVPDAAVMMISGNHDSADRLNVFRHVLEDENIYMIGLPPAQPDERIQKVSINDEYGNVNFYLLPFVKPSMVKLITGVDEYGNSLSYDKAVHALIEREEIDISGRNVLVSHQFYLPAGSDPDNVERMDSEIRTVGNIDEVSADILENFDYAALGHIHKPMKVGNDRFCYCGTPMPYSVSEAGQEKGIIMIDMYEKGRVNTQVIPLRPLRQVRVIRGELPDVLTMASDDYVSVVLTDRADLDVMDMQDRLRFAFPHLLEIKRENVRTADYSAEIDEEGMADPFELCCRFLGDTDEYDRDILSDVINSVMGGGAQ